MTGDPFASRASQIGDYAAVPCGGAHVEDLRRIGPVVIEKIQQEKDRLRIRYCLNG